MPIPPSAEQQPKPWYRRPWVIALAVVAAVIAIACAMGDDDDDDDDADDDGLSEQFDGDDDEDDEGAGDDTGLFAVVTIVDSGSWKITTP